MNLALWQVQMFCACTFANKMLLPDVSLSFFLSHPTSFSSFLMHIFVKKSFYLFLHFPSSSSFHCNSKTNLAVIVLVEMGCFRFYMLHFIFVIYTVLYCSMFPVFVLRLEHLKGGISIKERKEERKK